MRLLDRFDAIRIVNLPERRDRRDDMDRELAKVGLLADPRVSYFPAIRPADSGDFTSIGARGCYLSHRAILREAAAAGHSLLVLEDDCAFAEGLRDYNYADDWDIFYGGYYAADPNDLHHSDIVGSHMMGFSRQGVERVSAYLQELNPPSGIHPPIDAAYVWFRRQFPSLSTKFAQPPLALQRSSRSDVAPPKWHHRLPFGRTLGQYVRKALSRR